MTKGGSLCMARYMGENRPVPPGIPKVACWSFPASCWKSDNGHARICVIFLIRVIIFLHLVGDRWIVKFAPSIIHPSISFVSAHVPSPSWSLRCETGSSPWCWDTSGGGKIEWMPCIMALEKWCRCSWLSLFVPATKSSTNTSRMLVVWAAAWSRWRASAFFNITSVNL